MKRATLIAISMVAGTLAGCQTLHADLTDTEMDAAVRNHFEIGMPRVGVEHELRAMSWVEVSEMEDGDLRALVWPKKFLIFGGLLDYYGTEILFFRFDSSDGLERVVYRPGDDQYVIDLGEEATP